MFTVFPYLGFCCPQYRAVGPARHPPCVDVGLPGAEAGKRPGCSDGQPQAKFDRRPVTELHPPYRGHCKSKGWWWVKLGDWLSPHESLADRNGTARAYRLRSRSLTDRFH